MRRDFRGWQVGVWIGGLGLSALAGALSLPALGASDAAIWAAFLLYVFALGYGANRLQLFMLKPPSWKSALVGFCAFLPMFLGWFPASNWLHGLGFVHGWRSLPSPVWILAAMFWGLVAPGGVYLSLVRRLAGRAS